MDKVTPQADVLRLIRFAAILWICYLLVLVGVDQILKTPVAEGRPHPMDSSSNIVYYLLLGFITLLCLGLSYWSWIQERLGRFFIPVIIAIITLMPILASWIIMSFFSPSPMLDPRGYITMLLPFLLIAFLLVAWQYRWIHMLGVIVGVSVLNPGIIWMVSRPGPEPFKGVLYTSLTQAVIFLTVGFSIHYLINRLRSQQESLEAANIGLKHYNSTLEQLATSRERNRLARELHDTLAHTLSGLSVQLETAKAYWEVDKKTASSVLDNSLATARSGLEETRRALKALRASPLDDLGLAQAISLIVEEAAEKAGLVPDLSIMDELPPLSPDVEHGIYRVAQEAVTNVVTHAQAETLIVCLEVVEGRIKLVVQDDGIGFDSEKVNNIGHFGLVGMRERAQLVGGGLDILSEPGSGTTVQLIV